jgi:hypothetical protein
MMGTDILDVLRKKASRPRKHILKELSTFTESEGQLKRLTIGLDPAPV